MTALPAPCPAAPPDRRTTIREYLAGNPAIMQELPPPELAERYSG
jgi:hypothetical protein